MSYFVYPPSQKTIRLRRMDARPPSIRQLRAKEDYGGWKCEVDTLRSFSEGEGYLIASADFALPDKWQAGVLLVPRALPVGLH